MKFLVLLSCIALSALNASAGSVLAPVKKEYALISAPAVLYTKGETGELSPLTTLPETYFVAVTGEESDGMTQVEYLDLTGFLPAECLTPVDYEPKYKYASLSLTVSNDGHAVNVRSAPDHTADNVIASADDGTELYWYGTAKGSAQVSVVGDEWYYVRAPLGGEFVRGYVYSLYVSPAPVEPNVIEPLPGPDPDVGFYPGGDEAAEENTGRFTLPDTREAVIVAALCLPVIIIMFLLFRKPKRRA